MAEFAFLVGIFSFFVYGLGLLGPSRLGRAEAESITVVLKILIPFAVFGLLLLFFLKIKKNKKVIAKEIKSLKKEKHNRFLFFLLLAGIIVNLVGVFGPELGFDALWYHLTIPKIYLQSDKIFFIPGGLYYYSAMPKLMEMVYLASLIYSPMGFGAKFIHFLFGPFTLIVLYRLSKKYLNFKNSILVLILFYSSLVVGWESITAYVDLARCFFELLTFVLFINWLDSKKNNLVLMESAIMLGLSVGVKLLSLLTVPFYLIMIYIFTKSIKIVIKYLIICIAISLPWFVFSFLNTGNPVYPVFSGILDQTHKILLNPFLQINELWKLFYRSTNPVSPVFLIFLPVVFMEYLRLRKMKQNSRIINILAGYFLFSLICFMIIPKTGSARFILPFLPVWSLFFVLIISKSGDFYKKLLLYLIIITAFINTGYRFLANKKYLAYLFGKETAETFLIKNLNFENGDFLDINGEIKNITKNNNIEIRGSHNLFYADFPFTHQSFSKEGKIYDYIVTQGQEINEKNLKLLLSNEKTKVKLYMNLKK